MAADWKAIRAEFPALSEWTYLNSATFGHVPRRALAAMEAHFVRRERLACADFMQWFDDADRIRELVARLVHCQAQDIAFVPNASSGLSLLLSGIDWKPGDRIVTFRNEFPNHFYFPMWMERIGVETVETDWQGFEAAITPRTRLVTVSTVSYTDGFRAPVEEMSRFLGERGVLFSVDGTQSVGALQFDIGRVKPDIFAVHGYKWLLSPNGAAFLYVSPEVRRWLAPNVMGWRSDRRWRNPEDLHHGAPELSPAAEKYEGGMIPFALLYVMGAVIEMMLEIGLDAIESRVLELTEATRHVLRAAGAELISDTCPHYDSQVIAARFAGRDARVIARELAARKVLVSARHGNLRISPHFYNNEEDVSRFAEALQQVLAG